MAATRLVEIQPPELKFTFELKRQSSCSVQLRNSSDQYVAFKVKTTSPKKYCVRPNIGIIKSKATCDFTVTMQAQKVAPPDLECKDKFLIQSTVVPFGTTEGDVTSEMFSRDSGKYIEEKRLRVVLISPPHSPVLVPSNAELKKDSFSDASLLHKDFVLAGIENIPPPYMLADDGLDSEIAKDFDDLKAANDTGPIARDYSGYLMSAKNVQDEPKSCHNIDIVDLKSAEDVFTESIDVGELKSAKDMAEVDPTLVKDFEELISKLQLVNSKLQEAEHTISKLTDERSLACREKDILKNEVETLRRKKHMRRIEVGFPLLYVCLIAFISIVLGYISHP